MKLGGQGSGEEGGEGSGVGKKYDQNLLYIIFYKKFLKNLQVHLPPAYRTSVQGQGLWESWRASVMEPAWNDKNTGSQPS